MRHQHKRSPVPLKAVKPPSKGKIGRRIIAKIVHKGREFTLHATKGYCSRHA